MKSNRIMDKRGEVSSLSVERAVGNQARFPPVQRTKKVASSRFGNFAKSTELSGALRPPIQEYCVSFSTPDADSASREETEFTEVIDRAGQFHESRTTGLHEPYNRG